MQKIIFLDIDGVLNSKNFFKKKKRDGTLDDFVYDCKEIDPQAVEYLNSVTRQTDAKFVISSSWRKTRTIQYMRKLFEAVGIEGYVLDMIGEYYFRDENNATHALSRGQTIEMWLQNNKYPWSYKAYVIIDDDSDMTYNQRNNFFHVNGAYGMSNNITYKIIHFLNQYK